MEMSMDKQIEFRVGSFEILQNMQNIRALAIFDEGILSFLNALSKRLLQKKYRDFTDIVSFGYWCRKAQLLQEKRRYESEDLRIGRGIVLHSCPSNVPLNFAYSMVAGLLSGNANIVRLPLKDFRQVDIVCENINALLSNEFAFFKDYLLLVKFESNDNLLKWFSGFVDSRVIWGGDSTIAKWRSYPLKIRANEIVFADRYSLAVINARAFLESNAKDNIIKRFYNDTYLFDQNACSSPNVVFWLGETQDILKAKCIFWNLVENLATANYEISQNKCVLKLTQFYKIAMLENVVLIPFKNAALMRIEVKEIDPKILNYRYDSGFFIEKDIQSLEEIILICDIKCQSITYFGFKKEEFICLFENGIKGVDRVVKMGDSMKFSLVWDGYDLIDYLSRAVVLND